MTELFVGYIPKIPPGIRRIVRMSILVIFSTVIMLGVVLVLSQRRFPAAFFEFTQERDFEGTIQEHPYPALLVGRPGNAGSRTSYSEYLLVALGKHGAEQQVAGFDGKRVKLRGKLIFRGADTAVEVMPNSVSAVGEGILPAAATDLGPIALTGEIVDTKCYLGVMNPGEGKVHKDCATRCLSGGIPPALIVQRNDGTAQLYELVNMDGQRVPNDWAASHAGLVVKLRGELLKSGDSMILKADLGSLRLARR